MRKRPVVDASRNALAQTWVRLRRWVHAVITNPVLQAEVASAMVSLALAPLVGPEAGFFIAFITERGWRGAFEESPSGPQQAHVLPLPNNQVTPGFMVYTTDVSPPARGASESSPPTISVDPHWFHNEDLAMKYVDLVMKPDLVDRHHGDTEEDRVALGQWTEAVRESGPKGLFEDLKPAYFHSPAPSPGAGIVLWKPVFTQYGRVLGVISDNGAGSVSEPPTVFPDLRTARAAVSGSPEPAKVGPWAPLPPELARQLHPAPVLDGGPPSMGSQVYIRTPTPTVRIRASRPEPIGVPRPASGTDAQQFGAAWYVSPHPRGAFAWRPVDDGHLVLLMTPSPQGPGEWRVQRWRDVPTALRNLGQVGVWGQRAPEFDPSPPSLGAHRVLRSPGGPSL